MYLINLYPHFAKNNPVLYSWLGPVAVKLLGFQNVVLVGNSLTLLPPSKQNHDSWIADQVKECSDEEWDKTQKICIPDFYLSDWYDDSLDGLNYFKNTTSKVNGELCKYLVNEIKTLEKFKPHAAISLVNDQTFDAACKDLGIKTIYMEGGPIRYPDFPFGTYYFDNNGVNGANSFDSIFNSSQDTLNDADLISIDSIIKNLYKNQTIECDFSTDTEYEIGVALQVEDDSNIVCYSNGYDNLKILYKALWTFPREKILIREHPKSWFSLKSNSFGEIDKSKSASEFILKCKRLLTINSSLAFEALILGKEVYVLGNSPLNIATNNTLDRNLIYIEPKLNLTLFFNVFIFCYLIPEWFFLNKDYFDWRLSNPSLKDIFNKNIQSMKDRGYFLDD